MNTHCKFDGINPSTAEPAFKGPADSPPATGTRSHREEMGAYHVYNHRE